MRYELLLSPTERQSIILGVTLSRELMELVETPRYEIIIESKKEIITG